MSASWSRRIRRDREGRARADLQAPTRLVWTNEESDDGAVTKVTFEEKDGKTLLVLHELYPSKEALDEAVAGMEDGMPEQFEQLDELLVTLGASV